MPRNFCTLFDKNYLARGLALHHSLMEECKDFTLWMLCMDQESFLMLEKLGLKNVRPLNIAEVEDDRLLSVKPTRTPVEYCWMFSSSLPLFILEKNPQLESITYLDADMYFYSSLDPVYDEFGESSILLIPHRFPDNKKHLAKTSGIYNVGMMIFKNDKNGLACLNWWKDRVIEWCFNRCEDGKLGDQLYLNDWTTRFNNVHVLENPGANIAPWNIERYKFSKENGRIIGTEKQSGNKFPLIFYHFHALKIYSDYSGKIRAYPITIYETRIYKEYLKALEKAYRLLRQIDPAWTYGCVKKLDPLRVIKQKITRLFRK